MLFFHFSVNTKNKHNDMVKCDKVDGKPCKCELEDPCIIYLIQTIISNSLKLIMGTLNVFDREELRSVVRIPNAGRYVDIYLEELDRHREIVRDVILEDN